MAIKADLHTTQFGIPFAGAYFRVVTAAVTRTRDPACRHSVMVDVVGYATKPQDDDTREVDFRRYHAPLTEIEAQEGGGILTNLLVIIIPGMCVRFVGFQDGSQPRFQRLDPLGQLVVRQPQVDHFRVAVGEDGADGGEFGGGFICLANRNK